MDYENMMKDLLEVYEKEMNSRKNEDYEVDKEQMKKLTKAYAFFSDLAKNDGGRIEPFKIVPKEVSGGVTAYFPILFLYGDEMKKFNEIMGDAFSMSIDCTTDEELCISFTIPNVYRKKK